METLELLVLVQFGAILYLIYRVHRLEQRLDHPGSTRRVSRPAGDGKVIPLLKKGIPPGPFAGGDRSSHERDETE